MESGRFLFNRKFLRNFLLNKNLSEGCATHGREVYLVAPPTCEVCASTHLFMFIYNIRYEKKIIVRIRLTFVFVLAYNNYNHFTGALRPNI